MYPTVTGGRYYFRSTRLSLRYTGCPATCSAVILAKAHPLFGRRQRGCWTKRGIIISYLCSVRIIFVCNRRLLNIYRDYDPLVFNWINTRLQFLTIGYSEKHCSYWFSNKKILKVVFMYQSILKKEQCFDAIKKWFI